jgi:predicted MFS family arabinose efflux permease
METTKGGAATMPVSLGEHLPPGLKGILVATVIACGPAMAGMMLTILLPILPEIAKEVQGGRDALVAMPTIGIVVGGVIAGWMIERWTARRSMLAMFVAFGVIGTAGMVLDGVALLASRFVMGIITTIITAASITLIGDFIYLEKRPRVLGLQMAGGSLAGIIAMNASAWINDSYGWRAAFLLFALIAVVFFLVGYLGLPKSSPPRAAKATPDATAKGPSALSVLAALWPLYLVLFALHMLAYSNNAQTPFLLSEIGAGTASMRATMISVGHAMIVAAAFCYPYTRRFLGSRWVPAFFLTAMASGFLLLGTSTNLYVSGFALMLLGVCNGTFFPHQSNLILAKAPPEMRGRAAGLMVSNQFLANSINPFLFIPVISAAGGVQNAIVLVGTLAALCVVIALIYGSRTANDALPEGAKSFGH